MNDATMRMINARIYGWLDEMIVAGQAKREREPGLHLSTVREPEKARNGTPFFCVRKAVLEQLYVANEVTADPYTVAVFRQGEKMHDRWQEWAFIAGAARADEIESKHNHAKYAMNLTVDGLFHFDRWRFATELKGYNEETCIEYLASGRIPTDAMVQDNLYLHFLRELYEWDDVLGLVLMESKNQKKITPDYLAKRYPEYVETFPQWAFYKWYWPFVFQYNPQLVLPYQERLDKILAAAQTNKETGQLPPRICESPDSVRAIKCGMRDVCFSSIVDREHKRIAVS